jgi:hypothetical protein
MQINYRNIVLIEKYNMNNKTGFAIAAIAIVAALLVTTSAMNPTNAFAGGHYKKRTTQTLAQENNCGNGTMPLKVDCQNAASQIQGKGNAAAVAASQGANNGHKGGYDGGQNGGYDGGQNGGYDGGQNGGYDGGHGSANGGKGGDANGGGSQVSTN